MGHQVPFHWGPLQSPGEWAPNSLFLKNIYLFIWLSRLLAVACGIFSCCVRTLSCGIWDLVP